MRFRPANIRLINRRANLPQLLLALSSRKSNHNDKNNPTDPQGWTGSLHIRDLAPIEILASIAAGLPRIRKLGDVNGVYQYGSDCT